MGNLILKIQSLFFNCHLNRKKQNVGFYSKRKDEMQEKV